MTSKSRAGDKAAYNKGTDLRKLRAFRADVAKMLRAGGVAEVLERHSKSTDCRALLDSLQAGADMAIEELGG